MPSRVGIDLIEVESVRHSLRIHAERYLDRIYTERERADCRTEDGFNAERLAARFAAKEATMKVLRPAERAIPWSAIGVRREAGGWSELELTGVAAEHAREAQVSELSVSLTHEREFAAAVVIAEIGGSP